MVIQFRKPLTILLSKANKPLSDKERAQLGKEWAERTLDSLLAYTKTEPSFGKKFCKKVESNNELAQQMLRHLRATRKGKPKGPKKWTISRYYQTYVYYEALKAKHGRKKALEVIGKTEGIGQSKEQVFNPKKVENTITKARKIVKENNLSQYLPPFIKNPPPK